MYMVDKNPTCYYLHNFLYICVVGHTTLLEISICHCCIHLNCTVSEFLTGLNVSSLFCGSGGFLGLYSICIFCTICTCIEMYCFCSCSLTRTMFLAESLFVHFMLLDYTIRSSIHSNSTVAALSAALGVSCCSFFLQSVFALFILSSALVVSCCTMLLEEHCFVSLRSVLII